ncbi:MAG: tetratricopeptide repeat protein [Acidimicrobiia bacterium]
MARVPGTEIVGIGEHEQPGRILISTRPNGETGNVDAELGGSPVSRWWQERRLALVTLLAGEYAQAAELAESVVAEDDSQLEALLTLAAAQAALGRRRHASAALDQAKQARPDLSLRLLRRELPYRDEVLARFMDQLEASGLG